MKLFLLVFFMTITTGIGFATTHTITNSGFTFSPDTITITAGDTIVFTLASAHNAVEVSLDTYNNNGNTSNGGFSVPFGGGSINKLTTTGNHYYVCAPHASVGMKGLIIVNPTTDVQSLTLNSPVIVYPGTAYGSFVVTSRYTDTKISKIEVTNSKGQKITVVIPASNQPVVNLNGYTPGLFIVTVYTDKAVVTRKIIVR